MAADGRLQCYEYGATAQAELFWAGETIEAIELRATVPEEMLEAGGIAYPSGREEVVRIHRGTLHDHLWRAAAAVTNARACGVTPAAEEAVGSALVEIEHEVDASRYTTARVKLNELRAKIRHPGRHF